MFVVVASFVFVFRFNRKGSLQDDKHKQEREREERESGGGGETEGEDRDQRETKRDRDRQTDQIDRQTERRERERDTEYTTSGCTAHLERMYYSDTPGQHVSGKVKKKERKRTSTRDFCSVLACKSRSVASMHQGINAP